MLTAATVLLANTLEAYAQATDITPADLYRRIILAANLEAPER